MQKNVVFVDSREGAMRESGDVILSRAKIYAELGEALARKVPARASETSVFKSLGMEWKISPRQRSSIEQRSGRDCTAIGAA